MPHIICEKPENLIFPKQLGDVEFLGEACAEHESKIITKVDGFEFLLTRKNKSSKSHQNVQIIKSDKATRPSKAYPIKKALDAFSKLYKTKAVFSNIDNLKDNTKQSSLYLKDIDYFLDQFEYSQEIWVEIGFGSGRHLLHQAKKNPDILLIGLEIHTPSIEQVLKQIELQEIKNVLILNYDARLFLEFLNSNSVGKIFVHFPVPWDKKPHRRVYSQEFVNEALRVLNTNSTLELRTDSKEYFEFALAILTNLNKCHIDIDINKELDISSKYEDRWKKMGKNIYDLILTNQITSTQIDLSYEFSFNLCATNTLEDKLKNLTTIKEKDYFVHFQNIFKLNDNSILLEVTFGSFNKPVSKYLLVENNHIRYFQGSPLLTKANILSHQKINEILKNDNS